MRNEVVFNIGDVFIRFKSNLPLYGMAGQAVCRNFIVKNPPKRVNIDIDLEKHPHYKKYKSIIFFSASRKFPTRVILARYSRLLGKEDERYLGKDLVWRIGKANDKILVEGGSPLRFQMLIDKNFRIGRIFIVINDDNFLYTEKFAYHVLKILKILLLCHLAKNRLGILVHCAGIRDGENGYMFAGTSNSGKSTISKIWSRVPGVEVLSDENIIIRGKNNVYHMYSTPWHSCYKGYLRKPIAEKTKLTKLFYIYPSKRNIFQKIDLHKAFAIFYRTIFSVVWDKRNTEFISSFWLGALLSSSSVYKLKFKNDTKIIDYVRKIK